MKIALVRARYSPYGGAERFAARAMQALAGQGADVTVIARQWSDAGALGDALSSAHLLRCDPFYLGSLWRDASFASAVRHVVRRGRFDLVQSHERIPGLPVYRAGDGVHAVWLERRAAVSGPLARVGMALNPHHRWLLATERKMFEHPSLQAVICNAVMVRDEILARFRIAPQKLHVIPNGVDLERFHPGVRAESRAALRARLGIDGAAPVFLLVGSGFERKGVATALQALALVDRDAHFIVVGSDKRSGRYQALAQQLGVAKRSHFVGPQTDTRPWYGASDVFVLPTLYDPFPNAALEALACGLPVITSDACGAREAVSSGRNGWICPAADHHSLALAMREAGLRVAHPETDLAMRHAARESVEGYGLDVLGERLVELYRGLME